MTFVGIPVYRDTRSRFNKIKMRGESADLLLNKMINVYENMDTGYHAVRASDLRLRRDK